MDTLLQEWRLEGATVLDPLPLRYFAGEAAKRTIDFYIPPDCFRPFLLLNPSDKDAFLAGLSSENVSAFRFKPGDPLISMLVPPNGSARVQAGEAVNNVSGPILLTDETPAGQIILGYLKEAPIAQQRAA